MGRSMMSATHTPRGRAPDRGAAPGASAASTKATRKKAPRRRKSQWVPPQHGAWAMLLVPYLAGLLTVGFVWPQLPLLVAWLAGYPFSYFALLAIKTRRFERYRTQLLVFGGTALATGAIALIARPRLLLYAPLFALVLVVNGVFASQRDDRALLNGLVSVVGAMLILPVVATVAGEGVGEIVDPFIVSLLYFAGTIFFVKTCIRERDNRAMFRASVGFHAVALVIAAWVHPLYAIPFAFYLVRAAALPARRMSPKQLGFVEIGSSVALLVVVGITA